MSSSMAQESETMKITENDIVTENAKDDNLISKSSEPENAGKDTDIKVAALEQGSEDKNLPSTLSKVAKAKNTKSQNLSVSESEALADSSEEEDSAIQELPQIDSPFPPSAKEGRQAPKKPRKSYGNSSSGGSDSKHTQTVSKDYIILGENTQADGSLVYNVGDNITLPDTALVGLKKSGENSGTPIQLAYPQLSNNTIDSLSPTTIEIQVLAKEDIIINSVNYNKPLFSINIIIR